MVDKTNTTDSTATEPRVESRKLYRLPKSGKIAGVCAGLAEYLTIDVTLVRLIFVILTIASGGFGVFVYLIMALIMPVSDAILTDSHSDIGTDINNLASEARDNGAASYVGNFIGIGLIIFGAWLLLMQFFPQWLSFNWDIIWPLALVFLGLVLVVRGRK